MIEPRTFDHKRAGEQHQRQMIIEERWLYTADGREEWFASEINPSMRVHLIKLPYGRLVEQTYTFLRYRIDDVGCYDPQIVAPRGSNWEFYGTDASKDSSATSAIWRRKHDREGWKNLRAPERQ